MLAAPLPAVFLPYPHPAPHSQSAPDLSALEVWLTQVALDWAVRVVAAMLVLIAAWLLASWARRSIGRLMDRPYVDQTLGRFLGNLIRWIILVVALIGCLGVFGFNVTSVATVLGAAGLAIGLALQGSLSNLAAGVMILLLRPFKVGDLVMIAGQLGKVDDIDLFQTKIDTTDNRRLIVPNASILNTTVENVTHHSWRRCDVAVSTAYAADLAVTRQALRSAGESLSMRQPERPVDVLLQNLGANGVEWMVRVWVPTKELIACRDQLIAAIKLGLDAAGVAIPFPQVDVWMRSGDNRGQATKEGSAA